MWGKFKKICTVIEFSSPSYINISHKIQEKMKNYAPLLRNIKMHYLDYRFEILPTISGALGYAPKGLFKYMNGLDLEKKLSFEVYKQNATNCN